MFLACANHDRSAQEPTQDPVPPPAVTTNVDATAAVTRAPARVRLCTFRGHHGFPGLTAALEDSCGERSATCNVASPTTNGAVKEIDVRVELGAPSDATCADRGTRVTSTCVLPATSTHEPNGRYPSGKSRLAPRASILVRVNGGDAGTLKTDAAGSPDPSEQCWTLQVD